MNPLLVFRRLSLSILRVGFLLALFSLSESVLYAGPYVSASSSLVPSAGTTYYVNINSGDDDRSGRSEDQAFRTLNRAVSKTNPGDTVLVMNGTYIGQGRSTATLRINRDGSRDNWITYKPYPGHSPLIQSNGAFQAIRIDASYILVEGFRVRGIRDQVSFEEAEDAYDKFKNGGGYTERVHGSGITTSHFNIVRNNEVYNFGGGGIEVTRTDSVIVENNLVYDNSHYSPFGHSGISIIYPRESDRPNESIDGSKYDIIIRGNISHSNYNFFKCGCDGYRTVTDGNGIIVDIVNSYEGWTLVANNLVFNNGGSGIHAYKTRNVDIINNTAFKNGQHPDLEGEIYARQSDNVNIINNIMYARSGQRVTNTNNRSGTVNYAHNLYYDGTDSPNVPTGLGEGDVVANPKFYNPSQDPNYADFRLSSNSEAIDSGANDYLPMMDIRGVERPNNAVDRGAYENSSDEAGDPPPPENPPVDDPPVDDPLPPPSDGDCGSLNQQAEDATLYGNMSIGQDSDASGGRHIHTAQGTGFKDEGNQNHRAEFCFTVEQSGVYRLKGGVFGVDEESDSFYVRINNQPSAGYLWHIEGNDQYDEDAVTDNGDVDPVTVRLNRGEQIVTVYQREDGARLDTLRLELLEADMPGEGDCGPMIQEAEDAELFGVFMVGTSPSAQGGQYIHAPEGSGSQGSGGVDGQEARFCFEVTTPGTYFIQGGVYSNDGTSDSFFVQVNGSPSNGLIWDVLQNTRYLPDVVEADNSSEPAVFYLDAGQHQVKIFIREDGTRLDWLELVRDVEFVATATPPFRESDPNLNLYLPFLTR